MIIKSRKAEEPSLTPDEFDAVWSEFESSVQAANANYIFLPTSNPTVKHYYLPVDAMRVLLQKILVTDQTLP